MANSKRYYFKPEQESLRPITTIYTVCDWDNSYGLESRCFYQEEEQAIKACLNNKLELTMIRKIEVLFLANKKPYSSALQNLSSTYPEAL